jgi:hypothetical protein
MARMIAGCGPDDVETAATTYRASNDGLAAPTAQLDGEPPDSPAVARAI